MEKISIGIVEDHRLVRQGMVALLKEETDLDVLFEAANGEEMLAQLKTGRPDIILLDINMPVMNGQQAIEKLRELHPGIKVIVITMHTSDFHITEMLAKGARGFLPKHCDMEVVIQAIRAVFAKGYYFDDHISPALVEALTYSGSAAEQKPLLSDREVEILKLICLEKSNQEISDVVFLSKRTVEWHKNNLLAKTNSKSTVGLIKYAIRHGIIPNPE